VRDILVTGARGFVAAWLIDDLLAAGARVVGVDRPVEDRAPARVGHSTAAGPDRTLPGGTRYQAAAGSWTLLPCALEEAGAIAEAVARVAPAAIFHLAAQSSAARSFVAPAETFACNVNGTLHLLEALRALPAAERPRLLAVGSAEEYGRQDGEAAIAEDAPLRPVSPYGVSKAAQSLLCVQYHVAHGLPVVVARSFSHTGPGQDQRFAFPSFARQIAAIERDEAEPRLLVGDLSPVRDFLDVRDVVRAYRALSERGEPGRVYNVCSGRPLTIRDGLDILLRGARRPITVQPDPARLRPADIPYLVGDGARLTAATGWRPERDFAGTLAELLEQAQQARVQEGAS
jgi:GDP-4-dehydro-6-deoxy-D-mannose reductase